MKAETKSIIREALKRRDEKGIMILAMWLFPYSEPAQNLTYSQAHIIKKIIFKESKRLTIRAMTRYGKTQVVAIAIAIYIIFYSNKKIKLIAPTEEQASILKNYLTDLIVNSRDRLLVELSHLTIDAKEDKLRAEASQKRLTFHNGTEYQILSVSKDGNRAMGHGGDLIVIDEGALISRSQYAKILRMLGDDPENSVAIELLNPWSRDSVSYDHTISEDWEDIKIDYKTAIAEGRTTEEFIEEMRKTLADIEFTVLYESEFPEQGEDSLFSLSDIERGFDWGDHITLKKRLYFTQQRATYDDEARRSLSEYGIYIGIDPADKGLDESVFIWGFRRGNQYEAMDYFSEEKSDTIHLSRRIYNNVHELREYGIPITINIDSTGVGAGVKSNLDEWFKHEDEIFIHGCNFGGRAERPDRFLNKKAENYWRLSNLLKDDNIKIPNTQKLKSQLLQIGWEYSPSTYKIRIRDPEKSPDFADALVLIIWEEHGEGEALHIENL